MAQKDFPGASPYKHAQDSVQRPDVGVEAQFSHKKAPRTYRYDSSLAPELSWDESADRAFAEWLLGLVADAAEKGEDKAFAEPQVWQGTEERFTSLSQCVARLRSLTQPFLNWSGKAERQQVVLRWTNAVNRLGEYGVWHYLFVTDPGHLGHMLNDLTEASWDEAPFSLS